MQPRLLLLLGVCLLFDCGDSYIIRSNVSIRRRRVAVTSPGPTLPHPTNDGQLKHHRLASLVVRDKRLQLHSVATPQDDETDWIKVGLFATVSAAYWYWMVLGGLAASQGWPLLPDGLPLHPGWPPSDADLAPVLEDSRHFFYLSELLGNREAPYVQPVRLAAFNVPEAWIFSMLPALWADPKRIQNKYLLLATWAVLGINLTNAFLAPYLLVTELTTVKTTTTITATTSGNSRTNRLVCTVFGAVALAVVAYAMWQCTAVATGEDWNNYVELVRTDRTYLAFAVDLLLFSVFQPILLRRVKGSSSRSSSSAIDYVPFVGMLAWLLLLNDAGKEEEE